MRLIHTQKTETGDFTIQEFTDYEIPPYVILSHTWAKEEVSYQEINKTSANQKSGYEKITQFCLIAKSDGYKYAWIDTCCIDKTSSAELSEAINSMYFWYRNAEICYTYLADVQSTDEIPKSKWLTRGWTLQELIAPSRVIFLNKKWEVLGNKADLRDEISDCTGIPAGILRGVEDLEASSVAQRMAWAAKRQTTRVEDRAYSLMGIFSVNMPLIYGEGENAFIRLQEEIMRISDDHSLFAWSSSDDRGGLLATSPGAFAHSHNIIRCDPLSTLGSPFTMSSRGVHLDLRFIGIGLEGLGLAILDCKETSGEDKSIAIYLKDSHLCMKQFKRVQSESVEQLDLNIFLPSQYPVRSICVQAGRITRTRKPNAMTFEIVCSEQICLDKRTQIFMDCKDPAAALFNAAKKGKEGHMWLLLTRNDVGMEVIDQFSRTPLSWAAYNGHERIAKLLLDRGAIIETQNNFDRTPLSYAAENGHEGVFKLLLERGAAIETLDKLGRTPLSWAAYNGHEGIFKLLLDRGVAFGTQDKSGRTPLSLAAEKGRDGIVKLLLDRGASVETQNKLDRTPLSYAAERGHYSIVKLLLDRGAAIETQDKSGRTPLSWAAYKSHGGIVKLLNALKLRGINE
jgi:ankyrin repeat protein